MHPTSQRWVEITPSEFPWEQEALQFVRDRLPDQEPYRAWSNFEFLADDGSVNEVDLLVLAPKGFFLVEIKSRPGTLDGDAGTWTWNAGSRPHSEDNPLILANRKAKRLAGRLRRQKAIEKGRLPFLQALVFCSAPGLNCQLEASARQHVHLRDREAAEGAKPRDGIIAALTGLTPGEHADHWPRVDTPTAKAVSRAMEQAGVRRAQKYRRVGDYGLARLLFEGPNYQDWEATHVSLKNISRRIRIYPLAGAVGAEARQTTVRAAAREFQILEGISHPGILRAVDYRDHELGPALLFEWDPRAIRLDHFLAQHGSRLSVDVRLGLLRQIAEALRYAHDRKLVHRALSPQSILVLDPESASPRIQLFNWQTGGREGGSTTSRGMTATLHLEQLVEEAATVYMAPEARLAPGDADTYLDVFSLGAVAFHLFAGRPPAASFAELTEAVREGRGLQLAAAVDGASKELSELIQFATDPEVSRRLDSVADFLDLLDRVENELTAPAEDVVKDPTEARAGQRLDGNVVVTKRLGKGSTAVVYLVEYQGKQQVLKLALTSELNDRLQVEGEVLGKLRHQSIVELHATRRFGERLGLLMAKAGEQTLGQRLRAEGRLQAELLQRFGEDLLRVTDWLEKEGVSHRDIKPDNLGVAPVGRGDGLHLVLFDFSLSRAPAEQIRAGTVPYLDPFLSLRKPPRWDLYAERFAVAMTLYEMATGTLPRWGDGRSDPAMLAEEARLDTELFETGLRESLPEFFQRALQRDYRQRFDNADEMLQAWRRAFARMDQPAVPTDHGGPAALHVMVDGAALDTELVALGLSTRAINALERVNALTVRDLLRLPGDSISHMRGVGNKTRGELLDAIRKLSARFPAEEKNPEPSRTTDEADAGEEPQAASVDLLARRLVPARDVNTSEQRALRRLLGVEGEPAPGEVLWPSQTDVADALGVTRARIGQITTRARGRWARNPALTMLRNEIAEALAGHGGVAVVGELQAVVLATRGSVQDEPLRSRLARAVIRAATEAERERESPRWIVRRSGARVLLALEDPDGLRLADYAEQLGRAADRLAEQDPLPSPARALETLQAVASPEGRPPLPPQRLVRLAAEASEHAAVSSRLEIYPRGMAAARAVKLAVGALLGARDLTADEIRDRIVARYPAAERVPDHPELDALLAAAGADLSWDPAANQGRGAYWRKPQTIVALSSGSTGLPRHTTGPVLPPMDLSPEVAAARHLEERLQRAAAVGAFLVLTVAPRHLEAAEHELVARFPVEARSLEEVLIRHMKDEAKRVGADWGVVLRADVAPLTSADRQNLLALVRRALPGVERELLATDRTLLLTRPGLLARYGEVGFLDALRERVGRRPGPGEPSLRGAWILVPADDSTALPVLDGVAVPVIGPGQWAQISPAWLSNVHRAAAPRVGEDAIT